jgi:hypothetical protein
LLGNLEAKSGIERCFEILHRRNLGDPHLRMHIPPPLGQHPPAVPSQYAS